MNRQKVVINLSQATIAKIDALVGDAEGKLPELRGAKIEQLIGDDAQAHVQRLQIQLASTKAAHAEMAAKLDAVAGQDEIVQGAVRELQEKLEQARVLAESRNKIIKSLLSIVNEVGF